MSSVVLGNTYLLLELTMTWTGTVLGLRVHSRLIPVVGQSNRAVAFVSFGLNEVDF